MIFKTTEQIFLDHYKIPTSRVLNAVGLSKPDIQKLMGDEEFIVAIGVTPCQKLGHSMRLKSWHCVQCSPANLGFRNNYLRRGRVYVCISEKVALIKIGSSSLSLDIRIEKLNKVRYGGASDWNLVFSSEFEKAGIVEFAAQKALRNFRAKGTYAGQSRTGECEELFSCTAEQAIKEINIASSQGVATSNLNSMTYAMSSSTIALVPRKDVDFRNGETVRHTRVPKWGDGVVIGDSSKDAVVVRFGDGESRQFALPLPALVKI